MTVDIFIAVAEKGGVENVINLTGAFLAGEGIKVRVIQAVYENYPWTDKAIDFFYLFTDRNNQDTDKFRDGYASFIKEHGAPDIILATNWPVMSYVSRQVTELLDIRVPIVSWLHNPVDRYMAAGYGGTELLRFADAHFAINRHIAGDIIRDISGAQVFRVNNPVDPTRISYSDNRADRKLFFAGRLSDQKNLGVLFEGVAKAKADWELTVIGEGDEEHKLKKLGRQLHISERTHFLGWKDNPWEYAKDMTFLVMSSLYEGFPVTAVEALLSGLPVISTPVDGVVELIRPGENGFLYPMNDSSGLTEILDYISGGVLPIPVSSLCRDSAKCHTADVALREFCDILVGLCKK